MYCRAETLPHCVQDSRLRAGHGRMLANCHDSAISPCRPIHPACGRLDRAYRAAPFALAPRHRAGACVAGGFTARCLLLSGCTVGFWNYQQITAPEGKYVQVNCNGHDGPPKLAYYPFHGIFIGVAVGPLDLRLRTPRGVHAHLDGDSVLVSGHTDKGNLDLTLN